MMMDPHERQAMREGAGFVGGLFRFLAVLALAATVGGAILVARAGAEIGIGATQDPLTWFVAIGGLIATTALAGIGYSLGIMCAIYDRQESLIGARAFAPRPQDQAHNVWQKVAERQDRSEKAVIVPELRDEVGSIGPPIADDTADQTPEEVRSGSALAAPIVAPRAGLWEWLTRERHIRRERG